MVAGLGEILYHPRVTAWITCAWNFCWSDGVLAWFVRQKIKCESDWPSETCMPEGGPWKAQEKKLYLSFKCETVGRRSTLYAPLGSLSQAQGENCEISSYIHQRVQNSNNSRRLQHLDLASIEVIPLGGKTFKAQKCAIILGGQCVCAPVVAKPTRSWSSR